MRAFLINYILLISFGAALVYSTTYKMLIGAGEQPWKYLVQLLVIIFVLFIIFIIAIKNRKYAYKLINMNIIPIYIFLFVMLCLVLTNLGANVGGAKSSINILSFNFQPIEFFKISTILYLAKILSEETKPLTDKEFLKNKLLFPVLSLILIIIEPDLGGTIIMILLILAMLFLNNKHTGLVIKITGLIFTLGILGSTFLYLFVDKMKDRIGSWLDPFAYSAEAGGNLIQSYVAISKGGLSGVGYLNSIQNTGFLFASSTDFVFSIIAEEFGIIGVVAVIVLLFTFSYQIYMVGYKSKRKYEYLVCAGIAFLILIQTAINIGGVTGVIPMTGVTLPFISRGVNSYIALNLAVLYVILIKLRTKEEEKNGKRKKSGNKYKKKSA